MNLEATTVHTNAAENTSHDRSCTPAGEGTGSSTHSQILLITHWVIHIVGALVESYRSVIKRLYSLGWRYDGLWTDVVVNCNSNTVT